MYPPANGALRATANPALANMSAAASTSQRPQAAPNRSPSTISGLRPQTTGAVDRASCGIEWQSKRTATPKRRPLGAQKILEHAVIGPPAGVETRARLRQGQLALDDRAAFGHDAGNHPQTGRDPRIDEPSGRPGDERGIEIVAGPVEIDPGPRGLRRQKRRAVRPGPRRTARRRRRLPRSASATGRAACGAGTRADRRDPLCGELNTAQEVCAFGMHKGIDRVRHRILEVSRPVYDAGSERQNVLNLPAAPHIDTGRSGRASGRLSGV